MLIAVEGTGAAHTALLMVKKTFCDWKTILDMVVCAGC